VTPITTVAEFLHAANVIGTIKRWRRADEYDDTFVGTGQPRIHVVCPNEYLMEFIDSALHHLAGYTDSREAKPSAHPPEMNRLFLATCDPAYRGIDHLIPNRLTVTERLIKDQFGGRVIDVDLERIKMAARYIVPLLERLKSDAEGV
jgi:hypothetical protein